LGQAWDKRLQNTAKNNNISRPVTLFLKANRNSPGGTTVYELNNLFKPLIAFPGYFSGAFRDSKIDPF